MIITAKGEEKIRDITNQSVQLHNKNDKAPSHSTQRTKPLGEHIHITAHTRADTQGITVSPSCWGSGIKGLRGAYSIPHPVPPKITPRARMVPATAPISLFVATLTVQRK